MTTRIIVIGAAGRMGRMLTAAASADPDCGLAGGTEQAGNPAVGRDLGEVAGLEKAGITVSDSLEKALSDCAKEDVIVDFSFPEVTMANLGTAVKTGNPMVIGTTGFGEKHLDALEKASSAIPIVHAPNMSIGMNLVFKLAGEIARTLEGYDIEIIEAHHRHKKDAPSGTAKRIASVIADALGRNLERHAVYGRKGVSPGRTDQEIGIHTVRAGDITGDHTILYCREGERIELKHQAHSRMTFARGAVSAAKFLKGKTTGLFSMKEVLGI